MGEFEGIFHTKSHETSSDSNIYLLFDYCKSLDKIKRGIGGVMLSLSKHLYCASSEPFNGAVEMLRQAQHDVLIV